MKPIIFLVIVFMLASCKGKTQQQTEQQAAGETKQSESFERGTVPQVNEKITELPLRERVISSESIEILPEEAFSVNSLDRSEFDGVLDIQPGLLNGTHTYTWPNGDMYSGEWKKGKMHGSGIYTWVDGVWLEGEFEEGYPVNLIFDFEGKTYKVRR